MNDTGVLQPDGGWEPMGGTEPELMAGAGEAEADGGLTAATRNDSRKPQTPSYSNLQLYTVVTTFSRN